MLCSLFLMSSLIAAAPTQSTGYPGGEALKAEVQDLVLKLDDDNREIREKAKARLIELGSAVLDLLPPPDAQLNADAKNALGDIREKLQKALALASVEASTVTLHGRLKLSQVLAEIHKQTGNSIAAQPQAAEVPSADPEINCAFDKTPFWTALDQVLDQAQLSIYPYGQPGALQLVPRGPHDLPRVGRATVVGPLRIEPVKVTTQRDLRSTTPPSLQVSLEAAWEPRLQPIAVKQRMADLKVVDSTGAAVAADDPEAEKEALPRQGSSALEMDVSMAMPAQGAKEIASMQGSLRMMILGRVETFSFRDLLDKTKQHKLRIAAATVTVTEVRKNGDAWEVFVQLRYDDAGDALESHRNWALQNRAFLKGPDGKPIEPDSMETTLRTPKEIGVGYVFALDKSPEKMTFVYMTPGIVTTKDFPYEVKGIKLP